MHERDASASYGKKDKMFLMMLYTSTVGKVCFHGNIMVNVKSFNTLY